MSRRAGEWDALEQDRDPVPGDEAVVDRLAHAFTRTADDIARLSGRLRRLADLDGWKGKAAETFAESADDTAEDLAKAEKRYREASRALRSWVGPVRTARSESWGALQTAVAARDDVRRHSSDALAGVAEPTPAQLDAQRRHDQLRGEAEQRLRGAKERLDRALDALHEAGERTGSALRSAAEHGKDGWRDNLKGKVRDISGALKLIVDVLGYVAMALAALTLVVALIATAPAWLFVAAVALGVTMLALHTALVLSESGKATWGDVGMDLLSLATAGYGARLASGVGKALPVVRARLAQSYDDVARAASSRMERLAPNFQRALNAGSIDDVTNGLRRWSDDFLRSSGQRIDDAAARARAFVEDGVVRTAGARQRLQHLDRDLAVEAAEIRRLSRIGGIDDAVRSQLDDLAVDVRRTTGAAWTGLGAQVGDATDQVATQLDGPEVLKWKDDLAQWTANKVWRLQASTR